MGYILEFLLFLVTKFCDSEPVIDLVEVDGVWQLPSKNINTYV